LPGSPVQAYFDPEKLEQVIVNLLSNAFKFTPQGGAIHLLVSTETSDPPGVARIVVRDTGSGITPDLLPHVFDRFYQVDESMSAPYGSSGIGLSLAHDVVQLHGGTIQVESTPRFGSTFTVVLPLGRAHLTDSQIADVAATTTVGSTKLEDLSPDVEEGLGSVDDGASETADRFTVLVADDNADIRAYLRGHMESRYRVLEAANGAQALEIVRSRTPDLVVSDIMMPELDGLGLLAAMRADHNTEFIPVILLTARATEEDLLEGLELGADAYLTKPFNVRELQARIDGLISSRHRLRLRYSDGKAAHHGPTPQLVSPEGISASDAAFLESVNTVLGENLADESFDVQGLASGLCVSRNTIHRRLRSILGITPSEHVRKARLERAAHMLTSREGNVSEVAYAVGFKSVSYFSFCFRDAFGVTPSTYRCHPAETRGAESVPSLTDSDL
ncbi:response regulator, partial [Rhodothermus sp. AH-315-K08]|nr:response regulator [Rhodothermus sp. AH-315-K08]